MVEECGRGVGGGDERSMCAGQEGSITGGEGRVSVGMKGGTKLPHVTTSPEPLPTHLLPPRTQLIWVHQMSAGLEERVQQLLALGVVLQGPLQH